jgi:hypothetical protein
LSFKISVDLVVGSLSSEGDSVDSRGTMVYSRYSSHPEIKASSGDSKTGESNRSWSCSLVRPFYLKVYKMPTYLCTFQSHAFILTSTLISSMNILV